MITNILDSAPIVGRRTINNRKKICGGERKWLAAYIARRLDGNELEVR